MLLQIEKWINRFTDVIGIISTGTMFLMLVNVFYDAIMRYFFSSGSIALQEMEWHLFSVVFIKRRVLTWCKVQRKMGTRS